MLLIKDFYWLLKKIMKINNKNNNKNNKIVNIIMLQKFKGKKGFR